MNPAMQEMLGQFDMNSPELKEQLDSLGTSPDQVSHFKCLTSFRVLD